MLEPDTSASEPTPFAHLHQPNASLYRSILGVFVAAKRRFMVHLRPEDVREYLLASGGDAPDLAALGAALKQLELWKNLRADPDTSRVTTVEEFHRARYLYQLTKHGEAAETALDAYDEALGRRGSLQSVALADIATHLRALLELASQDAPDPAKVHLPLRALTERFSDLAANAQAFMSSLQRTIDLHDADAEAFLAYKDRLIEYLERFITGLVGTGAEIAQLIEALDELGAHRLLGIAAEREASDAAPGADGSEGDDAYQREVDQLRVLWDDRWQGFRGWFIRHGDHPSQASLLRSQARSAVPRLLQVVSVLNDRRSGRSDRSADFRTLAVWFAEASDERDMHRLWRSAFGLHSARHLTVNGDTLDARSENPVPGSTSWADAPALHISPRLRTTGQYERKGRPNKVVDRSLERRLLAERNAAEAAETAAARAALASRGQSATGASVRLSDIGELAASEFGLFLNLIGDALGNKLPGSRRVETTTSDGTMAVLLAELDAPGTAHIRTPAGVFHGPDHLIHIVDLSPSPRVERTA